MSWNSDIVPLRKKIIKLNAHVLLEIISDFALGFKHIIKNGGKHFQTGFRFCLCHAYSYDFNTIEDDALASASHMGEEAMFNRIVLGGIRRIVCDANGNAQFIRQGLQVLFEDVVASIVAAAAITKQENFRSIRIVELAMS